MKKVNTSHDNQLRTSTLAPPVIAEGNLNPEFAGYKKIRELFDLSRTHVFRLSAERKIRTVSLRQQGKGKGRRLYDVQSVRDYLTANMEPGVAND